MPVDPGATSPGMIRKKKRRRASSELDETPGRKRRRGSRKQARLVAVIAGIWVVLTAGMAVYMRIKYPEKPEESLTTGKVDQMSDEDRNLLFDHGDEIGREFSEFIRESNPLSRSAHVLRAPESIVKMTRLTSMTSEIANTGRFKIANKYIFDTPAGKAIGTLWSFDTKQQIEAVFFQEDEHWKIDWEDYSRYSPDPWQVFLAGGGESVGEFRLLARQRAETGLLRPNQMGLTLSLPKFGSPGETSISSPQIVVDRDSEIGQQLQLAFNARAKGEDLFGSRIVENDPENQIRVRVKVSREIDEKKTFKIDELIATHWFRFEGKKFEATSKP